MTQKALDGVLDGLNGKAFESYRSLQQELLDRYNDHLTEFPPHYSFAQFVEWFQRNNWIREEGARGYVIQCDEVSSRA
ncbi:MAG: hypothetical protein JWL77_7160 [Chthonomonadaceae bacterium]|nr:hypothetical protein [Chthonomonadaceae bacterium]